MACTGSITPEIGGIYLIPDFDENDGLVLKNRNVSQSKFFIVIGIDTDGGTIGFLYINSKNYQSLTAETKSTHMEISMCMYPFLDRDSFIDCSDINVMVVARFQSARARGKIVSLYDEDLENIKSILISNPTAIPKKLRRFGLID